MNTNRQTAIVNGNNRESTMKSRASSLIRWSGVAAMVAGIIFAGIQPIHPADVIASVTTVPWAIITSMKTVMCLLFLIGIAGIYARQVEETGRLGLAGFLVLIFSWWLQTAFVFAETFILPLLATDTPQFVEGFLGIITGRASAANLGALPALYALVGVAYMLGGLLFGIATLRAGILPRWAAGLLAVVSAVTPAAALLPHEIQRLVGIPVGLAIAWLGFALWTERHAPVPDPVPDSRGPQLRQTGSE